MSEIALDAFVTYKPNRSANGFEFYPEPRRVERIGSRTKIVLGDIPLPENVPHPRNAMTLLYGFKDSLEEVSQQYKRASAAGMSLVKVSMKLDVGEIISGTATAESIQRTRFLRVRGLSMELQQEILDEVNRRSVAENGHDAKVFERMPEAGARPDLLCDAIRGMAMFRHINSVAYTVPDGSPRGRQVATIFSTEVSELTFRGEGAFDIELPVLD